MSWQKLKFTITKELEKWKTSTSTVWVLKKTQLELIPKLEEAINLTITNNFKSYKI